MYLNNYQKYIAELIDEYGSLLCRQILAAVNHKFNTAFKSINGYISQMCKYGDYEKVALGTECILCRKGDEPDYGIIHSFDVLLSFLSQIKWHRKGRDMISIRFFISTLKHDKEMFIIPVQQGNERAVSEYAADRFDMSDSEIVIFLLETKDQIKFIHTDCNCRFALITSDGVAFYKKKNNKNFGG